MRPEILFPLFAPVSTLKGVGPKILPLVEKLAGPLVRDMLFLQPQGVIQRRLTDVANAREGEVQTLKVKLEAHFPSRTGDRQAPTVGQFRFAGEMDAAFPACDGERPAVRHRRMFTGGKSRFRAVDGEGPRVHEPGRFPQDHLPGRPVDLEAPGVAQQAAFVDPQFSFFASHIHRAADAEDPFLRHPQTRCAFEFAAQDFAGCFGAQPRVAVPFHQASRAEKEFGDP